MLPTTLDQHLYRTWQAFNANFGSLRLFGEQIAQIADRLDRQSVSDMAEVLADVFDEPQEEVEAELLEFLPSLDDLELYPNFADRPDVRETLQYFKDRRFKARVLQWAMENPRKSHKLAQAWADCFSEPPAHGLLLRRSALISLVGTLEILLEALFFSYYFYVNGNSTAEDEAQEAKARQQAEKAMGGGWRRRIEKFGDLGIDLTSIQDYLDELVEITQRRNTLVHNQGVIDADYMKKSPPTHRPIEAKEGLMLVVSTRYLERAFDVVLLIAFGLSQTCWRQWRPAEKQKKADRVIETLIYQTLRQGRYELVQDLALMTERTDLSWQLRQLVLVNAAIAFRERGDKTAMRNEITRLKRKRRGMQANIALAILQENFLEARRLMKQAADKSKLHQYISPYWPLFAPIKNEPWFKRLFDASERDKIPKSRR
ncbi:MAG: hypothetical protein JXA21_19645 [Anaerolineae bacterium]|nr:hypothetical protein [Anaerolineae bacterium]